MNRLPTERENFVTLREATDAIPMRHGNRVHKTTVQRWASHGIRGVRLEVTRVGGRCLTSHEAVTRFLQSVNAKAGAM